MVTKEQLIAVRAKMEAALKGIEGVSIKVGSCKYDETGATFKVEVVFASADGVVEPRHAKEFKRYVNLFGMKETDLNKEVRVNGETYTFVGVSMSRRKYPMLGKDKQGRIRLFTEAGMKAALGYTNL